MKAIKAPWAEPGSRFTLSFEAWAIEAMLACSSLGRACALLRIRWSSAQLIIDRAVERGMAARSTEGLARVGLDEKSFLRGHSYVSLMTDIDRPRVLEVVPGRKASDIEGLWMALPEEHREKVVAAAMDMGAPFVAATARAGPAGGDRPRPLPSLQAAQRGGGQDPPGRSPPRWPPRATTPKGGRYLWLHGTVPEKGRERFEELLEINLKTSKTWLLKEQMVEFWSQPDAGSAAEFFEMWRRAVMKSRIPAIKSKRSTWTW